MLKASQSCGVLRSGHLGGEAKSEEEEQMTLWRSLGNRMLKMFFGISHFKFSSYEKWQILQEDWVKVSIFANLALVLISCT